MGRFFEMSDEEKNKIRDQHISATKAVKDRNEELKKGLQKKEKKEEPKTEDKK